MNGGPPRKSLNIVTVVYSDEIDLLKVQARSIARFLSTRNLDCVQVIVNDRDAERCRVAAEALRPEYGAIGERLQVLTADEVLAARPATFGPRDVGQRFRNLVVRNRGINPWRTQGGWRGNRGWAMQQALKLAAARRGESDFILILDAKNHFVKPVALDDFVGPLGLARSFLGPPSRAQWSWIKGSFALYGLPPPDLDVPAPPSTTPFCLERDLLRRCIDSLESKVGPVEGYFGYEPFMKPRIAKGSEFMIIYAHVVAEFGSWEAKFESGLVPAASINRKADSAQSDHQLTLIENGTANIMSIHNSRRSNLTVGERRRVEAIWADRGLDVAFLLGPR